MRQPVHCWLSARAKPVPREPERRSKRMSHSGSMRGRRASRSRLRAASSAAEFPLPQGDAGASILQRGGEGFNQRAGGGERWFQSFSTFQAGELVVLQPVGLGDGEADLVLHGRDLLGGLDGVELGAEAGGLLAVCRDLAVKAGAQGFLAAEGIGGGGSLTLGGGQCSLGLGHFAWQGALGKRDAGALQIHALQFHEVFDVRLHSCYEVYGI